MKCTIVFYNFATDSFHIEYVIYRFYRLNA